MHLDGPLQKNVLKANVVISAVNLKEAQNKFVLAKKKRKKIQIEIDNLRQIILKKGGELDPKKRIIKERNQLIYKPYKKEYHFQKSRTI